MTYVSNIPSQGKIEGKFYPLRMEEHLRACKELTPAQRDVLYYIKTLAPSAEDRLNTSIKKIAAQLGLSRATVSRALKALKRLGWIEMERKTGIEFSIDQQFTNI